MALSRELEDAYAAAHAIHLLGTVAWYQGDIDRAAALHEQSLPLFQELGDWNCGGTTTPALGLVAQGRGDLERAASLHKDALRRRSDLGDKPGIAECLERLAAGGEPRGVGGGAARGPKGAAAPGRTASLRAIGRGRAHLHRRGRLRRSVDGRPGDDGGTSRNLRAGGNLIVAGAETGSAGSEGRYPGTAKRRHSPGTPLSMCTPQSSNTIADPATRSLTVLGTQTVPGLAWAPDPPPPVPPPPNPPGVRAGARPDPQATHAVGDGAGAADGAGRAVEDRQHRVAGGLDLPALVAGQFCAHDRPVTAQEFGPPLIPTLGGACRGPDDVDEEHGGQDTLGFGVETLAPVQTVGDLIGLPLRAHRRRVRSQVASRRHPHVAALRRAAQQVELGEGRLDRLDRVEVAILAQQRPTECSHQAFRMPP